MKELRLIGNQPGRILSRSLLHYCYDSSSMVPMDVVLSGVNEHHDSGIGSAEQLPTTIQLRTCNASLLRSQQNEDSHEYE